MGRNRESVRGARLLPDADRRSPKGPTSLSLNGSGGVPFRGARLASRQPRNRCSPKDPTSQSLTDRAERRSVVRAWPAASGEVCLQTPYPPGTAPLLPARS